jgi:23S rRNA (pseudouridine1915-N3)-methyltransferase
VSTLVIVAVGRMKERGLSEAVEDYLVRIRRHFSIDVVEVEAASPGALATVIEKKVPASAQVVALDVGGKAMSSEAFARWLDDRTTRGKGKIAFLIGGAEGLPPATLQRAHERISLSMMTLPHRLARLLLAEQLYRAVTILRNEPYARLG